MFSKQDSNKYNYEKRMLSFFLRQCPIVSWKHLLENPDRVIDFLFKEKNETIGIELTRCIYGKGSLRVKEERFLDLIVENALLLFQKQSSLNLHINVFFMHTDGINKSEGEVLSKRITKTLLANENQILKSDISKQIVLRVYIGNLKAILSVRNVGAEMTSNWKRTSPCWVWEHPYQLLQQIIEKKSRKIVHYRKYCDKAYLLITANRMCQSECVSFDQNLTKHVFFSKFDEVFFFDIMENQVFKLTTVKWKKDSPVYMQLKRENKK